MTIHLRSHSNRNGMSTNPLGSATNTESTAGDTSRACWLSTTGDICKVNTNIIVRHNCRQRHNCIDLDIKNWESQLVFSVN